MFVNVLKLVIALWNCLCSNLLKGISRQFAFVRDMNLTGWLRLRGMGLGALLLDQDGVLMLEA